MNQIIQSYNSLLAIGDKRVQKWPLVDTPMQAIAILIFYSIFIYFGMKFMKNRQAFELRKFLLIYNFFQVIGSFYIFYEIIVTAVKSSYSLVCEPVDYSNNPLSLRMAAALWMYYVTKLIDLIDTVVFVLRKKHNQITFLHLFHHISMVLNAWSGVKYVPGGQTFFLAMLNSLVHTIMYAYYGLSALGPKVQKYLWWKKYLTQFQLIQFFFVLIHSTVNYFAECNYPKGYDIAFIIYGVYITLLFLNFYRKSYSKAKKLKEQNGNNGHAATVAAVDAKEKLK